MTLFAKFLQSPMPWIEKMYNSICCCATMTVERNGFKKIIIFYKFKKNKFLSKKISQKFHSPRMGIYWHALRLSF